MAHDPQRPIPEDPGLPSLPAQRNPAGTATISRAYKGRERQARPPVEHPSPRHHLPLKIAGIIGVLLLGGLIAGLVVSHTPSTAAPAAARALSSFGAHGSASSANFTVPSSPVTSSYGYSCPAGASGRFIANLVQSNGADSQAIVNTTSASVSGTATLHPAHVGNLYHVAVTAPAGCAYRINTAVP